MAGILVGMSSTSEAKPSELVVMLGRLEEQMRRMQEDFDARLDAIAEAIEMGLADEAAEALAAERVRSGAAQRAEGGEQALAELGIVQR